MSEQTEKPADPAKRNRILFLLLSLAFLLLLLIGAFVWKQLAAPRTPTEKELADAYYEAHKHEFYRPTGNEGEDPLYLSDAYDKSIWLQNGAVGTSLSDSNIDEHCALLPPLARILELLSAAKEGDAVAYNACFTEEYRRVRGEFPAFTPQKIYKIEIRRMYHTQDGGEIYSLSYYIKDNDGSLRRDIVSDRSRAMYLTMVKSGDTYLISGTSLDFVKQ